MIAMTETLQPSVAPLTSPLLLSGNKKKTVSRPEPVIFVYKVVVDMCFLILTGIARTVSVSKKTKLRQKKL